ncbi:LicD family protein [Bifidobacterium pseudocatenulatum]|uniref:LicD family protein n=1 Tax=Bifidobacterium pseudocatenulatum TaxID=28026 RepID=UPI000E4B1E24|nr:LicD family protein [Bifidobacterium pseudocatenulatum]RHC89232.1 hypothetical protein DW822_08370 [Bifidobacterium pseudocatenulatum]
MLSQDQQIQQVQQRVLDIYKVFKALCEKHDLHFFSSGGTSIGAVLYNGFIPWDDDIDINMPREDYDKFIEIAKTELPSYLELFNAVNSTHSDIHFLKLHDNRTMFTADILLKYPDCYTGIFIDIEPVDSAPTDSKEREKWYYEVDRLYCYDLVRKFGKTYLYPDTMEWIYPNRVKRAIAYYLLHLFPSDFFAKLYEKKQKRINRLYSFHEATHVTFPRYGMFRSNHMWETSASDWNGYVEYPFEDTTIRVPTGYEDIMLHQYGFIPTMEKQKAYETAADTHHIAGGKLDLQRSYKEYQNDMRRKK